MDEMKTTIETLGAQIFKSPDGTVSGAAVVQWLASCGSVTDRAHFDARGSLLAWLQIDASDRRWDRVSAWLKVRGIIRYFRGIKPEWQITELGWTLADQVAAWQAEMDRLAGRPDGAEDGSREGSSERPREDAVGALEALAPGSARGEAAEAEVPPEAEVPAAPRPRRRLNRAGILMFLAATAFMGGDVVVPSTPRREKDNAPPRDRGPSRPPHLDIQDALTRDEFVIPAPWAPPPVLVANPRQPLTPAEAARVQAAQDKRARRAARNRRNVR